MASEHALQKAAQCWCTLETGHIEMIPELAEAFANEIDEIWDCAWLGNATTAELLKELQARAELGGYANSKTFVKDK